MIDEKKIKEATEKYLEEEGYKPYIEQAFQDGAQWAQDEFIKSLWHDASEEPKEHSDIVYIDDKGNVWSEYDYYADNYDDALHKGWQSFINSGIPVVKWCYLSDVLPKNEDK